MPGAKHFSSLADEELMQHIVKGDQQAFGELYGRYSRKLYAYLYRLLDRNQEKAEDFLQDVFMKIIEKPEQFDSGRKFSTWVYTVATNLCRNEIRNAATRSRLVRNSGMADDHLQDPSWHTRLDNRQFRSEVQQIYAGLNDRDRALFVLRFQHDMPLRDIAEIIGCPEGTVKSASYYLLKRIAEKLPHFKPDRQ